MRKLFVLAILFTVFTAHTTEEGMFPLSELKNVDLKAAGLQIPETEVYNPNGVSLVDAVVRVNGCTGSFVSDQGLIITNHHCAFGSIAAVSNTENDYIQYGFLAETRQKEIPAQGMECRITADYKDVSAQVLTSDITGMPDPVARLQAIRNRIKEIEAVEQQNNPKFQYEISEMFTGKTYVLFKYKILKDVRIVYVPARSIGEFGGEADNWEWPRHSGDFAFLRAYVGPDGEPAEYAADNVPFKPVKHLKVQPKGVQENDFVFILGYPGRTYRHQPSQFVEHQQQYILPYISELYDWQIHTIEELGKEDYDLSIRMASRVKRLSNVTKNYKGKMQGLRRTTIIQDKKDEEKALQQFIESSATTKKKYGTLLADIDKLYQQTFASAPRDLWLGRLSGSSSVYAAASWQVQLKDRLATLSKEEQEKYLAENGPQLVPQIKRSYRYYDPTVDRLFLKNMLMRAMMLPKDLAIDAVADWKTSKDPEGAIDKFLKKTYESSKFADINYIYELLDAGNWSAFLKLKGPATQLATDILSQYTAYVQASELRSGELNKLLASLVEVKMLFKKTSFIPDANSTFRLTYGYIKGYFPEDGVYQHPITGLKGIIEKNATDPETYPMLDVLKELYAAKDYGPYKFPNKNDIPVGLLYNMDTTGGNSGSPILNAFGELIGVNFDRAYTATINDYAWNEKYSRSVGVDIRYVLFILDKVANAQYLINEMGVQG